MFECDICYQRRRNKKVLECDHVLCKQCWTKWSSKTQFYFEQQWPVCPICRHPQGVPEKNHGDYRVAVALFLLVWWLNHWIENAKPS